MKRIVLLAVFALCGCTTDHYDRPGATDAETSRDLEQCQQVAMSAPQQPPPRLPGAGPTTSGPGPGNSSIGGPGPSTQPPGTGGQGFAGTNAVMDNQFRENQAMHDCMTSRGYTLRKN